MTKLKSVRSKFFGLKSMKHEHFIETFGCIREFIDYIFKELGPNYVLTLHMDGFTDYYIVIENVNNSLSNNIINYLEEFN